jgi:DNA (cytosine-5)-methyltransferase 1
LFCGAGGVAVGLARAGFEVVGVDKVAQPHYPFKFVLRDALQIDRDELRKFDLVWASPPCQAYIGFTLFPTKRKEHPKLIEPVREMLRAARVPYVIENVMHAPLLNPVVLCGSSFGLRVWRHRKFETTFPIDPVPCRHGIRPIGVYGSHSGGATERVLRARSLAEGQAAMGYRLDAVGSSHASDSASLLRIRRTRCNRVAELRSGREAVAQRWRDC